MTSALLVIAGAAFGAPLRYLTDLLVRSRHDSVFPWGTLTANVLGSLILGVIAAAVFAGAPSWILTLLGTGFCGALTTFSTYMLDTRELLVVDQRVTAGVYLFGSLAAGLLGVWVATAGTRSIVQAVQLRALRRHGGGAE